MPPIIGTAMRRITSEPAPVLHNMGSSPAMMATISSSNPGRSKTCTSHSSMLASILAKSRMSLITPSIKWPLVRAISA